MLEVGWLVIAVEDWVGWLVGVEVLGRAFFMKSMIGRVVVLLVGAVRYGERCNLRVVGGLILHGRYDPLSPLDDGFLHADWPMNAMELMI